MIKLQKHCHNLSTFILMLTGDSKKWRTQDMCVHACLAPWSYKSRPLVVLFVLFCFFYFLIFWMFVWNWRNILKCFFLLFKFLYLVLSSRLFSATVTKAQALQFFFFPYCVCITNAQAIFVSHNSWDIFFLPLFFSCYCHFLKMSPLEPSAPEWFLQRKGIILSLSSTHSDSLWSPLAWQAPAVDRGER